MHTCTHPRTHARTHGCRGRRLTTDAGEFWTIVLQFINILFYLAGIFILSKVIELCSDIDKNLDLDIPATAFANKLVSMTKSTLRSINGVRCQV